MNAYYLHESQFIEIRCTLIVLTQYGDTMIGHQLRRFIVDLINSRQ